MFCAISGHVPKEPVFATKTGHVYEKSVILKALETSGKCPVTGESLTAEDVALVKPSKVVTPRPPTGNSIPSLLQTMATEWDTLMLETYELRKQLQSTREELVRTLYERDAATRVIARLIKERDAALANSGTKGDVEMSEASEPENKTERMRSIMKKTSDSLTKYRVKNRKVVPKGLVTQEQLQKYKAVATLKAHKTTKPAVTCVDVSPGGSFVVSGGADGQLKMVQLPEDYKSPTVISTLSKHSKPVTNVRFVERKSVLVSTSQDKTAIIWGSDSGENDYANFKPKHTITKHQKSIIGCSVHPSQDYVATISADGMWVMTDLQQADTVFVSNTEQQSSCAQFHPDGLLLGLGCENGLVQIWDAYQDSCAADMVIEGSVPVTSLSFSNNGYYLAVTGGKKIFLYDLRKQKVIKSIDLTGDATMCTFDSSGHYLAAGDSTGIISTYYTKSKTWEPLSMIHEQNAAISDLSFGPNATFLASACHDRSLTVYSV